MFAIGYRARVKTIESIRMANYRRLVSELQSHGAPVRPADIARALGISKVYAWQLENEKRDSIDSKAARLMEREMRKPVGWMDTDFDLWPFPDAELLSKVQQLGEVERAEIQGVVRKLLQDFQRQAPARQDAADLRGLEQSDTADVEYSARAAKVASSGLTAVKTAKKWSGESVFTGSQGSRKDGRSNRNRKTPGKGND